MRFFPDSILKDAVHCVRTLEVELNVLHAFAKRIQELGKNRLMNHAVYLSDSPADIAFSDTTPGGRTCCARCLASIEQGSCIKHRTIELVQNCIFKRLVVLKDSLSLSPCVYIFSYALAIGNSTEGIRQADELETFPLGGFWKPGGNHAPYVPEGAGSSLHPAGGHDGSAPGTRASNEALVAGVDD